MAAAFKAFTTGVVGALGGVDLVELVRALDVIGPRFQHDLHELLFGDLGRGNGHVAPRLEQVGHAARASQVSAVLREDVPDLRDRAVAVVGGAFDQDRDPAGP
jgi:hypothetical protein